MGQIITHGIPKTNFWYSSSKEARQRAHRYAREQGLQGYHIVHDQVVRRPGHLPHFHVVTLNGERLPAHFFYGPRPPRKVGRWSREYMGEDEGDPFLGAVWDWLRPGPAAPAAVAIVPRSGWGAKAPKCTQALKVPVRNAFIHHTAGSTPTTTSGEQSAMRGTQSYHQNSKGWCDIAYNFLIMPSGRVYEGRGWNRVNGATKGFNSNSLAFCWAGNYDTSPPTQESIDAGRALLAQGIRDGYLTHDFVLRGHRDVGSTACPGRHLYARLGDLDPR